MSGNGLQQKLNEIKKNVEKYADSFKEQFRQHPERYPLVIKRNELDLVGV